MIKNIRLKFISFFLLLVVLDIAMATAKTPENYDPNTEITISGDIIKVLEGRKGPGIFLLKSVDKTYQVITGPRWYLWKIGLSLKTGMNVEVTGSKLYDKKGRIRLIVYSLKDMETKKNYHFRRDNLKPLWRGRGKQK
ncbi:MAG: hypothetical protein ABFR82_16205 [Nitrospirota bacterium]